MVAVVLPETFKTLREQAVLSQSQCAEKLGLSKSMIKKYEQGTSIPSPEVLDKMMELYGLDEWIISKQNKHPLLKDKSH